MYIEEQTLDDVLNTLYSNFINAKLESKVNCVESSKGKNIEVLGVTIVLTNPLARLSRTEDRAILFSCLGEFLWYLTGNNLLKFIQYYIPRYDKYSDDGITIHGGYGPRIFNKETSQFQKIIDLLSTKKPTRQAVIQIFDKSDLYESHKDTPCTCTMQFFIRNNQLHLVTHMRSNDAYLGLPHDIFAFTMIQELLCRVLEVELGTYRHFVSSLHIYNEDIDKINKYLSEGFQSTKIQMPEMPVINNFNELISNLMSAESEIRLKKCLDFENLSLNSYWQDICRLLGLFKISKEPFDSQLLANFVNIKDKILDENYLIYAQKLEDKLYVNVGE